MDVPTVDDKTKRHKKEIFALAKVRILHPLVLVSSPRMHSFARFSVFCSVVQSLRIN